MTKYLLFGGSGILGSGFRAALGRAGADVVALHPQWSDVHSAARVLAPALSQASPSAQDVAVVWAAGVGHTGAAEQAMAAETAAVSHLRDVLAELGTLGQVKLSVLFASSAGALYGGHGATEITEDDPPRPITPYGVEKLRQEQILSTLADHVRCSVVICRYTNLYGLAGGLLTPRGLVSMAVRATRLREPMVVYVSSDTRRDLVYNVDAAAESVSLLGCASDGVTTALVCGGETHTVSEILALVGRVSGRRVPANYAERPETRVQPRVLRFRRPTRRLQGVRRTPIETSLHIMLRAPLAR
jgi:UDP-glucose 4-epimerase